MPKGAAAAGGGAAAFAAGHVNGVTSDRASLLRTRSSLELSRELARGLGKSSGQILRSAVKLPAAAVADVAAAVAAGRRKHEQPFERCAVALPPPAASVSACRGTCSVLHAYMCARDPGALLLWFCHDLTRFER